MSKFLSKIEAYDPTLAENLDQRDEFRHLLKAAGLHSGNGLDGTLYIDDPENNRTFVVRLDGITQGAAGTVKPEEDGEADDAIETLSKSNQAAAQAKASRLKAVSGKLPVMLKDYNNATKKIANYKPMPNI
jgi:hypothetical protein